MRKASSGTWSHMVYGPFMLALPATMNMHHERSSTYTIVYIVQAATPLNFQGNAVCKRSVQLINMANLLLVWTC